MSWPRCDTPKAIAGLPRARVADAVVSMERRAGEHNAVASELRGNSSEDAGEAARRVAATTPAAAILLNLPFTSVAPRPTFHLTSIEHPSCDEKRRRGDQTAERPASECDDSIWPPPDPHLPDKALPHRIFRKIEAVVEHILSCERKGRTWMSMDSRKTRQWRWAQSAANRSPPPNSLFGGNLQGNSAF